MAYDEQLVERTKVWAASRAGLEIKKMFGGYCYLIGGNMLGGVKENLILRLGPDGDALLGQPHIQPFPDGKPMSGFLQVEPAGCATDDSLVRWLDQAYAFAAKLPPKVAKAAPGAKPAKKIVAKAKRPAKKAAARAAKPAKPALKSTKPVKKPTKKR